MLGGIRLKVVYAHEKTCFAYISQKYSTTSEQSQSVQVISKEKQVLLWAVYSNNTPEGHLACNPIYCRLLGLEEGSTVFVSPNGNVKVLDELFIDTESPDDQEILEHNVEILQLRILDQLRLVVANQKAMVWISTSMPIVFTPKQTGVLVPHSRIIVKVDAFNSFYGGLQSTPVDEPEPKDIKFNNIGIINKGMLQPYINKPQKLVLRVIPIDSDGKRNLIHPYTVFIHEHHIEERYKKSAHILATMTSIPPVLQEVAKEEDETDNSNNQIEDVCVEIVGINNVVYRSLCHEVYNKNIPTVLIPKSLNSIIHVENGTRLILTIIGDNIEHPDHIDIVTYCDNTNDEFDVIEKFKNCVIDSTHSGKQFLINNDMVKQNNHICDGFLKFKLKPEKMRYAMLNSESFRHCSVSAKCLRESELNLPKSVPTLDHYSNYCKTIKSIQSLVDKVLAHIYFEIHREATFKGVSEIKSNVLITGPNGSGKSSICNIVRQNLTIWSHTIHCRSLKGRKDIPEVLAKAVLMCQEHSPSVLICDDVDSLVPPNVEGASPQDIAYYQRLAVVIKHVLQTCAGVCVLMTALSLKDLHETLRQFNGKPLFTAQFTIPELEKSERAELISHLLNDKIREEFTIEDDDVIKMAADTAGCTVRDVADYLNKKIFNAVKKKNSNPEGPKPRLVEDITKDSEKAKDFDIWGPVGGMHSVKQQLTECIFWPIMYPALFPSQSCGILLYGPPGTGKSHIGSCLAKISNMNLIVVKGPELLSKYIGQSEKAVRDVFDKADAKRPCILFFDEFDSLAPKRGHDSTGVTDRVVNQLLARLDGAEGGAGGAVLAATSRPDLVDPALLRPGRLAAHVYVAPPTEDDRYEVLQTLCQNVTVSPEVDLRELANKTEGFSPADLKSLLVTAQLTRLEAKLIANEEKTMESVVVLPEDIQSALEETRPSLTQDQRLFYDVIYKRFRGESLTQEQRVVATDMQKQRVTLA